MKVGTLHINPYGDELKILYTKDKQEVIDYIKKYKLKEFNHDWINTVDSTYSPSQKGEGACFISFDDLHFVCFQQKPSNIWDISIVVHESLHLTNKILYRRGLYLTPETEEAFTYLQQFIFREICGFLGLK